MCRVTSSSAPAGTSHAPSAAPGSAPAAGSAAVGPATGRSASERVSTIDAGLNASLASSCSRFSPDSRRMASPSQTRRSTARPRWTSRGLAVTAVARAVPVASTKVGPEPQPKSSVSAPSGKARPGTPSTVISLIPTPTGVTAWSRPTSATLEERLTTTDIRSVRTGSITPVPSSSSATSWLPPG